MIRRSNIPSLALLLSTASALAADGDRVVTAGAETADAAAVSRALARVPPFQLAAMADTDPGRRRAVVERVLAPELQGAAEARARGLDKTPRVADRLMQLYARALEAELARVSAVDKPITDAEVQQYFDQHRERFETPRRIRIWRIVVNDEGLAKKIIADSQGAGGPARWSNFAREHSLDAATKFRDGDLGFVRPDGSTETPRLRVDPALFTAVEELSDGQIAPAPIQASGGIAVVWRRGSLPATKRTVSEEAPAIRTVLGRERLERARQALIDELRRRHVPVFDPQLLETLPDATFAPKDSPSRALPPLPSAQPAPAGAEVPKSGERGTR